MKVLSLLALTLLLAPHNVHAQGYPPAYFQNAPANPNQLLYPSGATPFFWWGDDNTVANLRLQIARRQQLLWHIRQRMRFIRFGPQTYRQQMMEIWTIQQQINLLQQQLQAYLAMHWR